MPIETATPEHVERCIDSLLNRIRQLEAENAELAQENGQTYCAYCGHVVGLDDPDRAAKIHDHIMNCEQHPLWIALQVARAEIERKDNMIAHLKAPQPCVHPQAAIVAGEEKAPGEFAHHCGWCADVARLRASLKWALVHVRYPRPVVPALAPTDAGRKFERGLEEARAALKATE